MRAPRASVRVRAARTAKDAVTRPTHLTSSASSASASAARVRGATIAVSPYACEFFFLAHLEFSRKHMQKSAAGHAVAVEGS